MANPFRRENPREDDLTGQEEAIEERDDVTGEEAHRIGEFDDLLDRLKRIEGMVSDILTAVEGIPDAIKSAMDDGVAGLVEGGAVVSLTDDEGDAAIIEPKVNLDFIDEGTLPMVADLDLDLKGVN